MNTTIARASFAIEGFTGSSPVCVHGGAMIENGVLRLTPGAHAVAGAVWYHEPVPLSGGFTTEARFVLAGHGGTAAHGTARADGFAFVIRGAGDGAVGARGQRLGCITHSVAVELGTCLEPGGGMPPPGLACADAAVRVGRITYVPASAGGQPRIRVFLDEARVPVLEVPLAQPLETLLGLGCDATAWVGFTASTGAGWQTHDLVSWSFAARSAGPV